MALFYYLILFLFGLGIGSFLNVVSLRFRPEKAVFDFQRLGGRSFCPHCEKILRWFELVPLASFLIQRGRCRSCGRRLSWQYPLVELLSGLIFVAVPFFFHVPHSMFQVSSFLFWLIWILIFLVLLLISLIDFRHLLIPNELSWILTALGLVLTAFEAGNGSSAFYEQSFLRHYALIFGWFQNIWFSHLLAALTAALIFGLIFYAGQGRAMGAGDIKLGFALGLILGWPDIMLALILAFFLGGAAGVFLLLTRRKGRQSLIPFAPFLSAGVALTVFLGFFLVNGYFRLFGI